MRMCFIIAKPHALHFPYCLPDNSWWNIKDVENGANSFRRHSKGLSLLAFRQLLPRDSDEEKWKEAKFEIPGASPVNDKGDWSFTTGHGRRYKDVIYFARRFQWPWKMKWATWEWASPSLFLVTSLYSNALFSIPLLFFPCMFALALLPSDLK